MFDEEHLKELFIAFDAARFQLHVHVIARQDTDKAWPNPVWNSGVKEEYAANDLENTAKKIAQAF